VHQTALLPAELFAKFHLLLQVHMKRGQFHLGSTLLPLRWLEHKEQVADLLEAMAEKSPEN
jgi:hypothetical protein